MAQEQLDYTEIEVRSYLPSGWSLVGSDVGSWDSKKGTWTTTVLDNVDYDWKVEVKPADVMKLGRLDAFRVAVDRVYRERLG